MKTPISTTRLVLREFAPEDAECFFHLNADPEVMKYTGDQPFDSVEAARSFISEYDAYRKTGYGRWTVVLKETNEPIGWCGLRWHEDLGYVDLGFRIAQEHWNKGYASEAGRASLDWAKENGIDRVAGRCMTENAASIRVLEKLGFSDWQPLVDDLHCGQIAMLDLQV